MTKRRRGNASAGDRRKLLCETLEARLLMAGDLTLQQSFYPDTVGPQVESGFARAFDAGDRYTVVGALATDTVSGRNTGQAYVYDASDQLVATLEAPQSTSVDLFGQAVVTEGDRVVVLGMRSVSGTDVNVIYVHSLSNGTVQLEREIITNIPAFINNSRSLALDGDRLAIGVPTDNGSLGITDSGAVYIYDLSADTSAAPLKIANPDPAPYDYFGSSIAIQEGALVVGTHLDGEPTRDEAGNALDAGNAGSVMIFDITSSAADRVATLESPQQQSEADGLFGVSLAIEGDMLIVGESGFDAVGNANAGAIHLFDLSTISAPVSTASIVNPLPSVNARFGTSVDLDGSGIVVGAPLTSTAAGSAGVAYLFDLSTGLPTATDPNRYQVLPNPDPDLRDTFGSIVGIRGASLWATVPFDPSGSLSSGSRILGSVERFSITETGVVGEGPLLNPTPATDDHYGEAVAITDRWMAIGVPAEDGESPNTGRVEIYDVSTGVAVLRQSLAAEDLPEAAAFGQSIAIHGDTLAVGAPGGSLFGRVYLYDLSTDSATLLETIDSPHAAKEQSFGFSLGFDGSHLVIGDRQARNDSFVGAGAAYVYAWDGSEATFLAQLDNPAPDSADLFGHSVAIDGETVVVGELRGDGAIDSSGLAHVFRLSASGATLYASLDSPNPSNISGFGGRVAVDGDSVLVGASGDDTLDTNSGAVYVYDTAGPTPVLNQSILRQGPHHFGASIAIEGDRLAIGAQYERLDQLSAGAVHLYQRIDGIYQLQSSLSNPGAGGDFGVAVAMNASSVLVGAPMTGSVGPNQGAAYLFAPEPAPQPGVTLGDDGTVWIIGTTDDDRVKIQQSPHGISIRTRLGDGSWQTDTFQVSEVSQIVVSLGDGEDRLQVTKQVSPPVITDDALDQQSNRKTGEQSIAGGWYIANGDRRDEWEIDEALLAILDEWSAG